MTLASDTPRSGESGGFERRWLAETIRLQEERSGPIDDADAVRQARRAAPELEARILERASLLAERSKLTEALHRWQGHARWTLFILALLVILGGAGTAASVLGDGSRPVNVVWAIGRLLGLNLLSLLLWLSSFLVSTPDGTALGRFWLWLTARLFRDPKAALLPQSLAGMLSRSGLMRWWLGLISHGLWLLALLAALAGLLALLATRRYGFVWETTILSADSFVAMVDLLGRLPAAVGFVIPDAATIAASGGNALADEASRRAWSAWLIGCLLIYGIAPRLLLTGVSLWFWRRREQLRLDLSMPGYATLRERLMPSVETLGVQDASPEQLPSFHLQPALGSDSLGAVLIGLELPDEIDWPPALSKARDAGIVASRAERNRLLETLSATPAERLLIACDASQSPDRGTLALISELSRYAAHCAVWLIAGRGVERLALWHESLATIDLPAGLRFDDHGAALAWLESPDD